MSILEEVLKEEYDRCERISDALEKEIASLPKGSIQRKNINGYKYYYLQFRDGDHVRSSFIANSEVDSVRAKVEQRKAAEKALKEQLKSKKQIERALGKKLENERAAKRISSFS